MSEVLCGLAERRGRFCWAFGIPHSMDPSAQWQGLDDASASRVCVCVCAVEKDGCVDMSVCDA